MVGGGKVLMSQVKHGGRSLSLPPVGAGSEHVVDRAEEGTELETSVVKL